MKYTKEFLSPLIQSSTTMSEVVRKIGHRTDTGFVTYLSKAAKKLNINTSHFKNKSEQARLRSKSKRNIEDYLLNKYPIGSDRLKNKLFLLKIKSKKCEKCGIDKWFGLELSLHLHHIDKNHSNNNLNNLMILCPNCHSCEHGKQKTHNSSGKRRSNLRPKSRKVIRPNYLTLIEELKNSNYCLVAKKYGVSDNTIRKWIKMYIKYEK